MRYGFEVPDKIPDQDGAGNEDYGIFPGGHSIDHALGVFKLFGGELAGEYSQGVVGAVHQHREFKGAGLVIDVV